jgi:hypothetical protein
MLLLLPTNRNATEKYLLALKCLLAAHYINPSDPVLHTQIARFRKVLDDFSETLSPNVAEIITTEFDSLLPKSKSPNCWNEDFLNANHTSAPHVQSALSVRLLLKPDSKGQVEKDLLNTVDLETASLEDAMSALRLLDEWESSQDAKSAFTSHAHKRWKDASAFQPK